MLLLLLKYEKIELVFVSHDTQVYEVDEEKFFNRGSSGGTKVSPALEYVYEQMQKRYNPKSWNLYTFQCSDGDNWTSDNAKTLEAAKKLKEICQLFGYCEVDPNGYQSSLFSSESLHELYGALVGDDFRRTKITKKEEIWASFKSFFGGKKFRDQKLSWIAWAGDGDFNQFINFTRIRSKDQNAVG